MTYTVRHAEDFEDIGTVYDLDRLIFPHDQTVDFSAQRWWIVEDPDGEAVAFAALQHMYADRGFLSRVGVLTDHRGHGLQKRLIRVRERAARRLDLGRLITYTAKENIHSSNNLMDCGYRLYRPEDEWGTRGALYWYRDL